MKAFKYCLILFILFSITKLSHGQTNYDSLRNIINQTDSDSIKMLASYQISKHICYMKPDSGVYYGWQAYEYANKAKIKSGVASAYSQIGFSYNQNEIIDSAVFYWKKSAALYNDLGDQFKEAFILNNIGSILIFEGKYEESQKILEDALATMKSLDSIDNSIQTINNLGLLYDVKGEYETGYTYYQEAFEMAKAINDKNGMGTSLNNISVMYYFIEEYEKSIEFGRKALREWKGERFFASRSRAIKNMAVSFELSGQIDSAIYYHNIALDVDTKLKNEPGIAKTTHNLGCLHTDQGDLKRGLELLLKAKSIKEKYQMREGSSSTYNYLGNIYTKLGKYNLALQNLEKGRIISDDILSLEDQKDNLAFYIAYHNAIGDYKNAFLKQEKYIIIKDSLLNLQTKTRIADLNIKYETSQKELENEKLKTLSILNENTISSQKTYLLLGLIGLGLISSISFFFYRQKEKQRKLNIKLNKQKNQIKLLNQELNHRVKNNLAFMTSLLEMQGRRSSSNETKSLLKESENRLKALSIVHDNLFNNEENTKINLKQYLTEITNHLQNIFSLPDKTLIFNTQFIDHNINAEDAMRFGLITNELVTNSVKHAFDDVTEANINISTYLNEHEKLVLSYSDNGPGIITKSLESQSSTSLGIKLIELLKKQLGENYIITMM